MTNDSVSRVAQGRSARLLHMVVALCAAALLIAVLRWLLADLLTLFLEPLLEGLVWFCLVILALICLVRIVVRRKERPNAEYKALGITAATFLILAFAPITRWTMEANFHLLRKPRERLTTCLLAQTCGTQVRSGYRGVLVALPSGSGYVSAGGGEVMIDHRDGKDFILFFTFRGILSNFSGYVYSPSDDSPAKDQFGGKGFEIYKIAPHWYWYAS